MISEQDSAEWIYNLEEALGSENKTQEQTDLLQELLQKFDIFNDFKEIQKQLHPIPEQVNEYVYQTKQKKQDEQIKLELQDLLLKVSKYLKLKKFGKNEVLIEPKGTKMRDMYFIFQGSISEYIVPQKQQQKEKNQEEDATLEMQKQQQKLLQELKAHEEKQRQQEEVRRQSSIQLFQQKLQSVSENQENQEEIISQHNDSQMIQQNPSDYQNYANNQNEQNNQRSVWTRKSKIFRESTFQKKMQIHARKKSLIRGKKIIDQLRLKQVRTYKKYDQIGTFEAMFKESKENYFIADQYTIVGVLKQEKLYLISEIMNYWADNIFKYLSNYFPKASKEQIQKLLNNSYTLKAIKDQTIYRQGQQLNNNFFLNLKGELSYFFEKKKLDQNFDEEDQTQLRLKKRILENIQYKQIKIIPEGEIFGETEIIQREKQRIGTVKQKSATGEIMVFKIDLINDFFLMDVRVKLDLKRKVKAKLNIVQDQQEKIQINNEKYSNYIEESRKTIKKFNESKNYLINNKKPQVHQEYQKTLEKDPKYTKKMENEICSDKYKTGYHRVHQKEDLKELKNVQKQLRSQKKKQMEEILYMEFPSQNSANKNTYLVIPTSSQISNDDSINQKSRNKIQTSQNLQENPSQQNIQNQDSQSLQKFNQIQQNKQSSQNLSLNEINLKQLQMSQSIQKNINQTQQKMDTLKNKVTNQQLQNQMLIEEHQTPVNESKFIQIFKFSLEFLLKFKIIQQGSEINNSVIKDQICSSEQLSENEINKLNLKKINEQRKTKESKKISILSVEESQDASRDKKDIKKKSQIYQQQTQTLPYINPTSQKSIKKNSYPYFRLQNVNQKDNMSKKKKLLEVLQLVY
ncbi:Cyclic nucleotide-binding protein [Pseudocohnilembus persalinus]|uniref:Cyclic nucleotide-binding protein n=1 Tax=Pseudocohnilembus persalinus TaxID=266149 RepID=A0A0V0R8A0_PSEPJ|nr:Cyclic nucleotide-binding protein [Pseudocohnilembus persalinus]|eukprot:KRX10424.1 Cyclic nucleotide-binding protein [Pseudocohnilembus persalinus]